ncbi:MAG: polyribonucleotide nucleotidyltransferase [Oleiphilaceae bacterium]|nr:polyribonucleotide nucleotidyltransferase [Oleiphilaceae bacterium]
MKIVTSMFLTLTFIVNLTACGTILYPERKGQVGGRIDIGVALLDALGLFLFFIPGVIAFAVDFTNGTIYLPSGSTVDLSPEELEAIQQDNQIDQKRLKELLYSKGVAISLPETALQVQALDDQTELQSWLRMHNGGLLAQR